MICNSIYGYIFLFTDLDVQSEPGLENIHEFPLSTEEDSEPNRILTEFDETDMFFYFADTRGKYKDATHKALFVNDDPSNRESNETILSNRVFRPMPKEIFQSHECKFLFIFKNNIIHQRHM